MRRRLFLTGAASMLAAGAGGRAIAAPQQQGPPDAKKLPFPSLPDTPELYRIIFENAVKKHQFDTAVLVVRRSGKTVAVHGHKKDAHGPTLIGSMSKPITAVAVATLIQNRRLKFTTPMKVALADFFKKHGPPRDKLFESVTVEQLLVHRSGLPDNNHDPTHDIRAARYKNGKGQFDVPQEVLAELLAKVRLVRPPGTVSAYCSGNYMALAAIIEQVSGIPYERYCGAAVINKLDMQGGLHPQWKVLGGAGGWFVDGDSYLRFLDVFDPHHGFLSNEVKGWIDAARTKWPPAKSSWRSLAVLTSRTNGRWLVEHGGGLNSNGKDADGKPITAQIESYGGRRADGISVFAAITPNKKGGDPGFKELKADIDKAHAQVTKL